MFEETEIAPAAEPIWSHEEIECTKNENESKGPPPKKTRGKQKIKIEYIESKAKRQITFYKRKSGLIKKAQELTTLTGTDVLLIMSSETGNVYSFATPKLQPLITVPENQAFIQSCLGHTAGAEPFMQAGLHSQPEKKAAYVDSIPVGPSSQSLGEYHYQYDNPLSILEDNLIFSDSVQLPPILEGLNSNSRNKESVTEEKD